MCETRWYIERSGTEYGPVTWDELQDLARSGRVRPTDMVRRDGVPYWQPAYEARADELATATPAPSAASPPPAEAIDLEPPDEASAEPAASATTEATTRPAPDKAGTVVLAMILAVAGLFWFGLLLGGIAVALAAAALRSPPRTAARRFAVVALVLGLADVAVMTATLVGRLHGEVRFLWQ